MNSVLVSRPGSSIYAYPTRATQPPHPHVAPPPPPLPEHNDVLLTRSRLITVLNDVSENILAAFGRPVRLVVHGGAVMLLHPGLYKHCDDAPTAPIPAATTDAAYPKPGTPPGSEPSGAPPASAAPTSRRSSTRDVDYIARAFAAEWRAAGMPDAEARLQRCIDTTARRFGLGRDWMNAHADVALPMATE